MIVLFLAGCASSAPLAVRSLEPVPAAPQGTERIRRGAWAVLEVSPQRSVLELDKRSYALTASGPHQVALPDVPQPQAAWISVPDEGPWGLVLNLEGKPDPTVLLVQPPGATFVQGALTQTHAVLGSVLEPQGVSVVVVDLGTGAQVDFPSVEQPRTQVVGVSPDGGTIATREWGSLAGKVVLDVHHGDRRTERFEVTGITRAKQTGDAPVPLVRPPSLGGHELTWTRLGDHWTIAAACDGCTLQRLPE